MAAYDYVDTRDLLCQFPVLIHTRVSYTHDDICTLFFQLIYRLAGRLVLVQELHVPAFAD